MAYDKKSAQAELDAYKLKTFGGAGATASASPTIPQSVLDHFNKNSFALNDSTGMFSTHIDGGKVYQMVPGASPGDMRDSSAGGGGFMSYDPRRNDDGSIQMGVGDRYSKFDLGGKYTGQGAFKDAGSGLDLAAMAALAAVTMGVGLPALMGAGAAGAGGGAAGLALRSLARPV
ncbi:hypothetical protein HK414_13010 [Ramlibacter terrae]|uniref:Uncharacterized protein n=1 Tax=Ramlibacter terrae TaxID=2732511 RepID=A0ABX6P4M3_9BURK|nr:hypothetical protein HK414_13010 [Ramlibacter terrae]